MDRRLYRRFYSAFYNHYSVFSCLKGCDYLNVTKLPLLILHVTAGLSVPRKNKKFRRILGVHDHLHGIFHVRSDLKEMGKCRTKAALVIPL